jgi:hypothetical protein
MMVQISIAVVLYGKVTPKNQISSQSPSNLDTRREDAGRPSEKGLIIDAAKAE